MTSMREHMMGMHAAHADFHARAAKSHATISKCFSKMAEATDGDEDYKKLAAAHEDLADAHLSAGEYAVSCAKSLDTARKAMGMGGMDDDRLVPDFVSSIAPDVPSNIRAVPRAGQREFNIANAEIPAGLEKVLGED